MSYFNHAYRKSFLGTKATQTASAGVRAGVDDGLLLDAGIPSIQLSNTAAPYALGVGTFGFFNPNTYVSVNVSSSEVTDGKPLVLAASSLMQNDKIGPFHGGYKESNKSKMINPKFIHKFSKATGADAEQSIWHLGNTNLNANTVATVGTLVAGTGYTNGTYTNVTFTGGSGVGFLADVTVAGGVVTVVTVVAGGQNYIVGDVLTVGPEIPYTAGTESTVTVATLKYTTNAACNFTFLCGETYNLRIDMWGSPVLRFLNHDLYKTLAAYTGCCANDAIAPTPVDSTLVMIDWANQIVNDLWIKNFVRPVVYTQQGVALFATAAEAVAAGFPAGNVWSSYVSPGYLEGATAGIRMITAYVETKFGNCSFQKSDFYEKEVVQMNLSLTDLTGNPCDFSALCATKEYAGFQGQGFGETILRDLILDESYLQNHFHSDIRIREITQGTDILNSVNRNALYTRYVIQHSVPRYNNPSGVYDNDQYALNIYIPATSGAATAFETFMATWLAAANTPVELTAFDHSAFTPATL